MFPITRPCGKLLVNALARLDLSVLRNCLDFFVSFDIVVVLVRDFCRGVISLWPYRRLIPMPGATSNGKLYYSSRACYGPFHTSDSTCGHDRVGPTSPTRRVGQAARVGLVVRVGLAGRARRVGPGSKRGLFAWFDARVGSVWDSNWEVLPHEPCVER